MPDPHAPMPDQPIDHALPTAARNATIYRGTILRFRGLTALDRLTAALVALLRATFAPHDPETAEQDLGPADFIARAQAARAAFRQSAGLRRLFIDTLLQAGVAPDRTARDWLHLRVLPDRPQTTLRKLAPTPPHRDSWGANIPSQTNWWAPLLPLAPARGLLFWPDHWRQPIANTSADWDVDALMAAQAAGRPYPTLPALLLPPDPAAAVALTPAPGELLCFSAAHLHGSPANGTGRARFNIEVRTVDIPDTVAGRGAPNLDGRAPRVPAGWFRRLSDDRPLPAVIDATRLRPPPVTTPDGGPAMAPGGDTADRA